ncbi:MAG: CBS domain-containing protein, partial [Actinomycetota bacterium]
MTESSFTFLRVRGIPVGAHWSWLLVFLLLSYSLSSALFPATYPGLTDSTYLFMGFVAALVFFASILLHELGHAFRALKEGMRIEGITLWLFGGVARFSGMFPSAGAEFRIAVAGPLVSLAIVALFAALKWGGEAVGSPEPLVGIADYLSRINLILVGFNLVPALPLDGGRILRAWLWHRRRSFSAATLSAARAGKAFAFLLIALGILWFFEAGAAAGIWFVFLGWFLLQAAQMEASGLLLHRAFRRMRVGDLMTRNPIVVSPEATVARLFELVGPGEAHAAYPVVVEGRPVGLVALQRAGAVPSEERFRVTIGEVMLRGEAVPIVGPDTPMLEALEILRPSPGRAIVVEDGRVAGIVSISDVARAVELERARGPLPEGSSRRAGRLVWTIVLLVVGVAGMFLYYPPFAVLSPGPAVDVSRDVTITGVPSERPSGKYLLTSVHLDRPNALMTLVAAFDPDKDVILLSSVIPRGVDLDRYFEDQKKVFLESQRVAAAAAARAAGLEVSLSGTGARVVAVMAGSPASRILRRGDLIVAIDAQPVHVI